jgi:hypothetical protein
MIPNQGVRILDLLTNKEITLTDISLSETGYLGLTIAGRIVPFADFHISSGTLIPLPDGVYEEKITPIIKKFFKTDDTSQMAALSAGQEASFTAKIIRVSLHAGGEDNVFYTDME